MKGVGFMHKRINVLVIMAMFVFVLFLQNQIVCAETTKKDITETEQNAALDGRIQEYLAEAIPDFEKPKNLPVYEAKKQVSVKAISKNGYQGRYGYQQLSLEEQKQLYLKLEAAADAFQNSNKDATATTSKDGTKRYVAVAVPLEMETIKAENIGAVVVCFLYDHPEYFWSLGYSYFFVKDDETGTSWGTQVTLACAEEYIDGKSRAVVREELQEEIERYLDLIAGVRTDYQKELILHDAIAEKITYAYKNGREPETERWAHSIVGVFSKEHYSAVCEGYAKAFQLLLNAAGIENTYIVGIGNGVGHAWNQVKIEGEWYYVDLTWNDTGDRKNYRYFNVDDSIFLKSHSAYGMDAELPKVGEWCYPVQTANATEYSYNQQGVYQQEDAFVVGHGQIEGATLQLFNQGVEVASGCAVASGTNLEVNIVPLATGDTVEVLTKWNGTYKAWKGVAEEEGISVTVPITKDTIFDVWVYVPVTQVKLNKTNLSITGYGVTKKIQATVLPTASSDKTITWKSSNTKVAKVKNGVVTSVSSGTAKIYAYAEKNKVVSTCKVTVNAPYIKISSTKSSLKVGKTLKMNGKLYGVSGKIKWSVSDTTKATIGSKSGMLKGKKAGTVWVIAKKGQITAKKKITIEK